MAHVNKYKLAAQATDVGLRINEVRQDPAVIKAARQAATDTAQAVRSIGTLAAEVRGSWRRTGSGGMGAGLGSGPASPVPAT